MDPETDELRQEGFKVYETLQRKYYRNHPTTLNLSRSLSC